MAGQTLTELEAVKKLLGKSGTSEDDLLTLLIEHAEEWAKAFCRRDDILPGMKPFIRKVAVIDYNKLSAEGLNAEGYFGVTLSYSDDYPKEIKTALRRFRRVVFI